jgi:peptidoglycan/LPS O-acetylase OafA/YrhL
MHAVTRYHAAIRCKGLKDPLIGTSRPILMVQQTNENVHEPAFFVGLQSLRGVAALVVLLYHIPAWYAPFSEANTVRNGYLMVDLFFVLSGFVLMHAYGTSISSPKALLNFVLLRLGRLYPVHIVFLLLFLAVEIARFTLATRFGIVGPNDRPSFQENGLRAFVQQLLLIQALGFTADATTFNGPSWSISTEFYTYLLFGAGILTLTLKTFSHVAFMIVAVSMGRLVLSHDTLGDFRFMTECLAGFFLGTLSYLVYRFMRGRLQSIDWPVAALVCIVSLMYAKAPGSVWDVLMFPMSALLILSLVLTPRSWTGVVLDSRPVQWLGRISYSLYMCHAFMLWFANQACRVFLRQPEEMVNGMLTPQLTREQAIVAYPLATLITLIVAWGTYILIEDPCRRWSRRFVRNELS